MRDFFFLGALPFLAFFTIKRPFIGVGLWIWTALFFPNAWLYGIASGIRYNLLLGLLTIVSYLFTKKKTKVVFGGLGYTVLAFWLWTTVTTSMTIAPPEISWEIWTRFTKVILLFTFIVLIIKRKIELDFLLFCLIFSIGFYGFLEALKYIASGGGHRIAGFVGHVLGDRNELAVAFVMVIPICFYLHSEYKQKSKIVGYSLLATALLLTVAVIGTLSRGGLLALLSVVIYFFIKTDKKIRFAIVLLVVSSLLLTYIPIEWWTRMETIGEADSDASFMGRVVAWKLSFILAVQNPIFGGGFKALETYPVWISLSQSFDSYSFFYTADALPSPYQARAAHSIYFQVLGDHGFVGLFIFMAVILLCFISAKRIVANNKKCNGPIWISTLSNMLRLSLFAYCVGGAALSFAYFDLLYAICAILIVLEKVQTNKLDLKK